MTLTLGRPLAATLLCCGLLAGAGLLMAAGLVELDSLQGERDAEADFLARSRPMPRLGKAPGQPAAALPLRILAGSETLAAASADALVRATVADAGGTVLSSRAEAKHEDGDLPGRIAVEAVVEGRIEAVQAILYRFETGSPLILVEGLDLEPAGSSSDDPQAPLLHVALTLNAFWTPAGTMAPSPQGAAAALPLR
jgi:general secretion pathway protein M